jgi:hypothetical protein
VKNIEIQGMSFFPVHVKEKSLESMHDGVLVGTFNPAENHYGTIGWELFSNFNLLIDCKHFNLALCDSLETLKQKGYPVDSFTEAKLLLNFGIAFEALIEGSPLCCILDTGATINVLNKDLKNGCNDHRILTTSDDDLSLLNPENKDLLIYDHKDIQELTSFKIEGKEFGPLTFRRIKSPCRFDAILGMEFLDSTLVFIDYENEKIYFFSYNEEKKEKYAWCQGRPQKVPKDAILLTKEEGYYGPIKICGYSSENVPYVNVLIEDKTIPAKIDLGYQGMIALPSDFIKNIDAKQWVERMQAYDKRGRIHENDVYEVKEIKIQQASIYPAVVEEISLESMNEASNSEEDRFGKIGWGSFDQTNVLVDCKHSTIAFCDSVDTLKKQGYPVDSFKEAPMTLNSDVITIEAQTEKGPLRCMLDTGSTFNLLNKDLKNGHQDIQELASFKIGGKEFGPLTFHQIKFYPEIDAILGMEFFSSNLVFIDFEKEKVYFFSYQEKGKEKYTLRGQAWPPIPPKNTSVFGGSF